MTKKKRSTKPVAVSNQTAPESPKAIATRRAVLDKAAELFIEQGVSGANLQNIAEAAGLTRTALYYYFRSKEEVLEAIVDECADIGARKIATTASDQECPVDQLKASIEAFVVWINSNRARFMVVERNEARLTGDLAKRHAEGKQAIFRTFQSIIKRGIADGVFRRVDPAITSFSLIGMCTWSAWWVNPDGPFSPSKVATEIAELAVATVLSSPKDFKSDLALSESVALIEQGLAKLKNNA